jgi:hypothetical protein
MKKLYFLDNEEKNRILNIHESATKRHYLNEQATNFGTIPNNPLGNNVPANNKTKPLGPLYQPKVGPDTKGVASDANWNSTYVCVPKTKGAVAKKLKDGSTAYLINGYYYYSNGFKRKLPLASNKSEKYTCNSPEFKTGVSTEDKAKKLQQYKQQIVAKTNENTKAIQKLLGLPETGVMDSGLLQKINEKLNGKPQEAPKADVTTQPKVEPLQQLPTAGVKTQQLTTMTPEQLTAGLQQKAAAATAGLKK